jgi:hypothetical protein
VPVEINGKTYRLSQATPKDITELDQWIAVRGFAVALKVVPADEALRIALTNTWVTAGLPLVTRHDDAFAQYLWILLRTHHPELDPSAILDLVKADPASVQRIFEALTVLHGKIDPREGGPEKNVQVG